MTTFQAQCLSSLLWLAPIATLAGTACNPTCISGSCDDGGTGNLFGDGPNNGNGDGGGGTTMSGGFGAGTGMTPFPVPCDGCLNVGKDPSGDIVLGTAGISTTPLPYIWIANSGVGTESKINTQTMQQVARYCTFPGCNADPSRSTVGLSGNVVVANRSSYYMGGVQHPERASAVRIAADNSQCVDRNGNGKIDTYTGTGDVPAQFQWAAGQAQSPDECVIWMADLTKDVSGNTVGGAGTLPRAAAYDAVVDAQKGTLTEYVYIGLYGAQEVVRLNAATGAVLTHIPVPGNLPYGAVVDKSGDLWVRNGDNSTFGVSRISIRGGDAVDSKYPPSPCGYGITADSRGYIYTAGGGCVARLDPAGRTWESVAVSGAGGSVGMRGLAVDSKFNVWAADTCTGLYRIDASKPFNQGMTVLKGVNPRSAPTNCEDYFLGVGLDLAEHPWIVSTGSSDVSTPSAQQAGGQSFVYHVDPNSYAPTSVATGKNSYTYSDMTGSALRIAGSPSGLFVQTIAGCDPAKNQKTQWTTLTWDVSAPVNTTVKINIRSAPTQAALASATFTPVTTLPGGTAPPFALNLPIDNQFLQVEFVMSANTVNLTPVLKSFAANYQCVSVLP